MDKIVSMVTGGKDTVTSGRNDDDFADRLSSRYTPIILLVFAVVVTIGQLVRDPITCWAPVHFTDGHVKYANSYCWVRNTYYLPYEDEIPTEVEDHQVITYYQWIQFILLTQAALFFFPTFIWRAFNSKAGVDADHIMNTANGIPLIKNAEKREDNLDFLASQIDRFLETRRDGEMGCQCDIKQSCQRCKCCGTRIGFYLVALYMFQKVLFIINIFAQFAILNKLLGNKFYIYGAQVLLEPIPDHEWTTSYYVAFPRVTMCDFKVRRLGNTHRYTLQCVLPINLYIEKMYIFLWFWMVFVFAVTIYSLCMWIARFAVRKDRYNFVTNHLKDKHRLDTPEAMALVDPFLDGYLRQDGAFLLRLVAINTNHLTTNEIFASVWDFWCKKNGYLGYGEDDDSDSDDDEDDDDGKYSMTDETILTPSSSTDSSGLKHRKKTPPDDDSDALPRKNIPERSETVYVRGSDTLPRPQEYPLSGRGAGIYPKISKKSDDSDVSSTRKPSAPTSEDSLSSPESSDNERDKSASLVSDSEYPKKSNTPEPKPEPYPATPTVTPTAPPIQSTTPPLVTPMTPTSPTAPPLHETAPIGQPASQSAPLTSPQSQPMGIPRPKPRPMPVTSADVLQINLPPGVPSTAL